MSTRDDLIHGRLTPAQVLDAMAAGAKPGSSDREMFETLAWLVRRQAQDLHDCEQIISDAWDALGHRNRDHLTLEEAILQQLREAEGAKA